MQAQAQGHISDQVIMQEASQVNVQLPVFAQQNENTSQSHMSNGGSPCGSWHIADDVLALREYITETIFQLFQPTSRDWQPQLLDFVRCLEDNLFKGASSKEEYMDLNTLEQRLQTLSKWISPVNCTKSLAQNAAASAGAIIKSPGISNIGNISPMSPNPVSDILSVSALGTSSMVHNPISMEKMFPAASGTRQEHGNKFMAIDSTAYDCSLGVYMLPQAGEVNSTFQLQQGIGAALMGTGNRMVPKVGMPGFGSQTVPSATLNTSHSMPTAVSSCGAGYAIVDSMATSQTKGNNINGSLDHHMCNVNGQITITMASNIQQENSSYGARNGGTDSGMHWIGNYKPSNTSQYVNQQMSSKQHLNQQRQQHFTQRDGCSTYIADFASNGNFYNSTSSRGLADVNSLFVNSEGSHSSNDLGSQQNTLQEQKQIEQSQFQCLDNSQQIKFVTSLSVLPRGQSLQSQQRQQYPNQQQKFQLQQHQQQQYQHEQLKFHQHQQRNYQPQQPKFLQHRYPHYQHQQIQGQQHSLSNSEGEQKAQPTSECFGLKQVGIGLPHLEVLQSQGELLQHEHQHFSQPPSKLLQLSGKFPQVQETLGQEVHHNSISPWQLHQQHTQQPQQLEASSSQQQQQIQPQINPFGHPSEVQPSGWSSGITELEQRQYIKQQQLLLFIHHGSKCSDAEGECQTLHCSMAKLLWAHVTKCHNDQCLYPRCPPSRTLLSHHLHCHDFHCPVCVPVRQSIAQQHACSSNSRIVDFANGASKSISVNDTVGTDVCSASRPVISVQGGGQIQQPPQKKPKVESASACQEQVEAQQESVLNANKMQVTSQMQPQANQQSGQSPGVVKPEALVSSKSKTAPAKMALVASSQHGISQRPSKSKKNAESKHEQVQSKNSVEALKVEPTAVVLNKVSAQAKQEAIQAQQMVVQAKQAAVRKVPASEISGTEKLGRTKVKGVSLMELFTPEQIKDHITGLQQWIGQSKGKAEKSQEVKHQLNENTCQLCMAQRLTFEPPPIYCTPCGTRIKRNAMYYSVDVGDTRNYFCVSCYNGVQGDTIRLDGVTHLKSKLKERENEEEIEEAWVQCDKCEAWQHQICALFNARRNESGKVDYTCPNCYMMEIERGKRKPLPQSAVLGAKDLPRTYLSDHIEQRLSRRLKQERQERAKALGKGYEEVPGAEALVVRVVSSIDKKVEVKQHFLEFYHDEDYPIELPYKSKVLLLFQKIEGVEVCLFGMYAQEFGSDCSHPNQRRVNISYLDSVKYFRPDVKTVTGEALRTLVYHEIMIGYLDYCKKRGFASCYIWACPPLKGEDYIFYCHPEIQKTPKCDKLREWYLAMLRKAAKENIVVDVTNLYDYFFTCTNECNAKVTAARLPYFDGDYWPGAVEDAIKQLQLEKEEGRKHEKNQKMKNSTIKWNSKAAAKAEFARNSSKDALLMKKLGESAYPMKDDLIMVHLHHACTRCRLFILSGKRWVCNQCKNFHLCDKCCEADKKLDKQDRHPISSMEKHVLYPIEVTNVPVDTKDADEIMESEFFDTRQAFLSLCQGNHYQYDTLRRAKHSSMMILYHLHNPTAPAFVSTCNVCHHDIETGQGWRCETCPDFDICSACYQNNGFMDHPHKLTPHPSMAEQNAQNQEARQERVLQLRKMLDLLVHASQCCSPRCQYTNCRRVKGLFRHGTLCKIRASGGCSLCKKMWYLLQLHGRACKASECRVPHCKDLRKHLRRLQQQMESRRRASVMEMMRRRVAGAAANSD